MTLYREVLRPAPLMYLAAAFIIPTTILVCAPFNVILGLILGPAIYVAIVLAMLLPSPVIEVTDSELRVGKAHIERIHLGATEAFAGPQAIAARGTELDARAWLLLRGWINPLVKVEITDKSDPTPYWLFSTRNPKQLVEVLRRSNPAKTRSKKAQ